MTSRSQSQFNADEGNVQEAAMKQVEQLYSSRTEANLLIVPVVVEKTVVVEKEKVVEKTVVVEKAMDDSPWWFGLLFWIAFLSLLIGFPLMFINVLAIEIAASISGLCLVLIFILSIITTITN